MVLASADGDIMGGWAGSVMQPTSQLCNNAAEKTHPHPPPPKTPSVDQQFASIWLDMIGKNTCFGDKHESKKKKIKKEKRDGGI